MLRLLFSRGMSRNGRSLDRTRLIASHMMSSLAGEEPVKFESHGPLRIYALNRPAKFHALNDEMLDLLGPQIDAWRTVDSCKMILATATTRPFCAGGDVATLVKRAVDEKTKRSASQYFQKEFDLDFKLATLPKPYIAIMDGTTFGGGVGLAAPAHFRIATENTLWAMPETAIGYIPDVGASYYLSRLDGEIGTYLGLTGAHIQGRHAVELGVATHFIPSRQVPRFIETLATMEIVEPRPKDEEEDTKGRNRSEEAEDEDEEPTEFEVYFSRVEELINLYASEMGPTDSHTPLRGAVRVALDDSFGRSTVEEIVQQLTKYSTSEDSAVSAWAKETLGLLAQKSPTSQKLTLEAIHTGRLLSLADCLRMELRVAHAYCLGASPDFRTGVTHVLIDKVKNSIPQWDPSTLEAVPASIYTDFFDNTSPYAKDVPKLYFEDLNEADSTDVQQNIPFEFDAFALPTERDVEALVRGSSVDSGSTCLTKQEILEYFRATDSDRIAQVDDKVSEIIDRKCRITDNEDGNYIWVVWKDDSEYQHDPRWAKMFGYTPDSST